jgi:cell division protein FtsB
MTAALEFRRRLRQAIGPIVGACVFGYFAYHAVQGDRGIMAWMQISQQLAEGRATLSVLDAERAEIQRRVALLSPSSLDPDMLDERARIMLNVAQPDDRLVIIKNGERQVAPGGSSN